MRLRNSNSSAGDLRGENTTKGSYPFLSPSKDGVFLRVYVQPGASENSLSGIYRDSLRIRVTSPPSGGEANKALIVQLSRLLRVKKSQLAIIHGKGSRKKLVKLTGVLIKDIERLIPIRR